MNNEKGKELLWVTPQFKSFMYERKARNHKKTFYDIQEDIMNEVKEKEEMKNKEKRGGFFGKL